MYQSMVSLPPLDPDANSMPQATEPGKRQWETNKTGYASWAVGQLLTKTGDGKNWGIGPVAEEAYGGRSLFIRDIHKSHRR